MVGINPHASRLRPAAVAEGGAAGRKFAVKAGAAAKWRVPSGTEGGVNWKILKNLQGRVLIFGLAEASIKLMGTF